jgi:phosphoserine aminotransferase
MARVHNFSAGPATLPLAVLERAQKEMLDYHQTGMSILEHSHRGATYDGVHEQATQLLRDLLNIGDDYEVLFLQGGASMQFAMLAMNFIQAGKSADYIVTGAWGKKALAEAKRIAKARAAADTYVEGKSTRVATSEELDLDPNASYVHLTSNNTIFGTQYHDFPATGEVPLVVDMSSDFLWRPLDISRFSMIYAGAQKNVGPSGLAICIVAKSLLAQANEQVPNILSYRIHAEKRSLYHTPNTFAIYMVRNVLEHVKEQGGLEAMEVHNRKKAGMLYGLIDSDSDFFRCPIDPSCRSAMNIVFNLPNAELEQRFVSEATNKGLVGLKGHRSVGGIRASIYNAATVESVEALLGFMRGFRASC